MEAGKGLPLGIFNTKDKKTTVVAKGMHYLSSCQLENSFLFSPL